MNVASFLVELVEVWRDTGKICPLHCITPDPYGPVFVGCVDERGGTRIPIFWLDPPAKLYCDLVRGEYRLLTGTDEKPDWFSVRTPVKGYYYHPILEKIINKSLQKLPPFLGVERHKFIGRSFEEILGELKKKGDIVFCR